MNLPNSITMTRIAAVPVLLWALIELGRILLVITFLVLAAARLMLLRMDRQKNA